MAIPDLFPALPDEARLWIYLSDRPLQPEEEAALHAAFIPFLANWQSHGRKIMGALSILDHRFLFLAGLIPNAEISGCGIDKSVHIIEEMSDTLGFHWLNSLRIAYRDQHGSIRSASRSQFREQIQEGLVGPDTSVFDLTTETLGAFRRGAFEKPARSSWHATAFHLLDAG